MRMEDETGTKLFQRKGRLIVPTSVGNVLIRRARSIIQSIDETQREIHDYVNGSRGHARLGVVATITEFLMPDILTDLTRSSPNVTLKLTIGMTDFLFDNLRRDELDVVISPVYESEEFDCLPIMKDQVVIVASRHHPLAGKPPSLEELKKYKWILPQSSVGLRVWLERAFERLSLPPPQVQVEINSLPLMPKLIAQTELLSFTSRQNLTRTNGGGNLIELPFSEMTWERQFGIFTRKGGYIPTASQVLVDRIVQATANVD
ncbi:LysR family transcriptional regulator [Sinorhizobium meliloti]|nr:LysR family transcriptional regulator [Sinorhizobium meliloti]MQV33062.1 LysR family transcriptional regulator [Sinorhizobium meliloti]RVE85871.1 LysR family transcriptional regulator [Sinorhizobium meliloti]RVG49208.1 LysR family transcriptional regulator [Sinorhizobium meliloti]RVM03710.1 LysR family transcriptional regulator [Sinorhizobium meliloti]